MMLAMVDVTSLNSDSVVTLRHAMRIVNVPKVRNATGLWSGSVACKSRFKGPSHVRHASSHSPTLCMPDAPARRTS